MNGLINFSGKPVIKHLAHELLAMEAMHQLIMQEECVDLTAEGAQGRSDRLQRACGWFASSYKLPHSQPCALHDVHCAATHFK